MNRNVSIRPFILVAILGVVVAALLAPVVSAHVTDEVGHLFSHVQDRLGYVRRVSDDRAVQANSQAFLSINCPQGREPVGGGIDTLQDNGGHQVGMRIIESYPAANGWRGFVANEQNVTQEAHIHVICMNVD